jgi:hypothetical protein
MTWMITNLHLANIINLIIGLNINLALDLLSIFILSHLSILSNASYSLILIIICILLTIFLNLIYILFVLL